MVGRFYGETDQMPTSSFYVDFGVVNDFLQSQKKSLEKYFGSNVL